MVLLLPDESEAKKALRTAKMQVVDTEARWPSIRALIDPIRVERQENHFAGRLRVMFEASR